MRISITIVPCLRLSLRNFDSTRANPRCPSSPSFHQPPVANCANSLDLSRSFGIKSQFPWGISAEYPLLCAFLSLSCSIFRRPTPSSLLRDRAAFSFPFFLLFLLLLLLLVSLDETTTEMGKIGSKVSLARFVWNVARCIESILARHR